MRLNPFSRSAQADSDEEEEVMRHKGRPTPRGRRMDAPDFRKFDGGDGPRRRPSQGRPRSRSRSRAMTPDGRRFAQRGESPPTRNNERGRDPTPGRSRRLSTASDSSPEIERRPSRRGSAASRASRRSQKSHTYPLTSSDEEEEDDAPRRRMPPGKQYRGPPNERGRPMRRPFADGEDGPRNRGRIVPASSMRRSRSRGASNSDDDEEGMMPHQRRPRSGSRGPPRSRSRDRRQSLDAGPIRKQGMTRKPAPTPKNKKSSWGFKMASPSFGGRRKSKDGRDDEEDEYNVELESGSEEENNEPNFGGPRRREPPMGGGRDPPPHHARPRPGHPHQQQAPSPPIAKVNDQFAAVKREKFANLYQYDNFPAIDRVPTAIGYRSDDSNEDAQEKKADDNGSVTSRYTVDVKSVRGSKLKKNKRSQNIHLQNRLMDPDGDDNFSHDENDDKYAQYNIGATSNAVVSDSDESCVPTWHPALDADESDWYEDDEATMKNMKEQQAKNKKYQVSDSKAKSNKKNKKGPASPRSPKSGKEDRRKSKKHQQSNEEPEEPEEEENRGDAIVANRSEASDVVPNSSRHPGVRRQNDLRNAPALGDEESEDERTEGRPSPRRRNRARNRSKGGDMDQDDETEYQEEEETSVYSNDYTEDNRSPKKGRMPPRKSKVTPMNGNSVQGRKKNMMFKGKNKAKNLLKNKFKFRRGGPSLQDQDSSSSEDESSEVTGNVNQSLPPTMSMYSEVQHSPRKSPRKADPALAKLELDEIKESTATHNMIKNNRKELLELDEMDDASIKEQPNTFACGAFPFMGSACFLGPSRHGFSDDIQLDSIQMQRLKDAKHELVNKPKVEVILQNLQDPLVEKYEQLEKEQKMQHREAQREKQAQQEIERREHEELLQQKKERRETEQRKFQLIQNKDKLALQEAPDLSRGKSPSFVMDISDWVLNLDTNDPTPTASRGRRTPLAERNPTPKNSGRDGSSSSVEKLPFSEIEVPTAPMENNTDEHLQPPPKTQQGWHRKKKRFGGNKRQGAQQPLRQQNGTQATQQKSGEGKKTKKKKGWFRR